ncbi:hypothetical protein RB195_025072 [Necator americanus]|uniref:Reverse transcriptase domain-containing protein n=1 Tax=Necator americanus TaxID=51031 RepID=A0ABR1EQT8_NECAM
MYADDIKIYGIYDDENYLEVRTALQTSLAKMSDWASKWDLRINYDKSLVMHVGISVDDNLNFTEHIDYIVRKACSSLFRLFHIGHISNPTSLTRLYKSFVSPHLEYGSQIWSPSRKKHIAKLEKVQETFKKDKGKIQSTWDAPTRFIGIRNRRGFGTLVGLYNDLRGPADDQVSVFILPDKTVGPGGMKGLVRTRADLNLRPCGYKRLLTDCA